MHTSKLAASHGPSSCCLSRCRATHQEGLGCRQRASLAPPRSPSSPPLVQGRRGCQLSWRRTEVPGVHFLLHAPGSPPTVPGNLLLTHCLLDCCLWWIWNSSSDKFRPLGCEEKVQIAPVPLKDGSRDMKGPYSGWDSDVQPSANLCIECHTSNLTQRSHSVNSTLYLDWPCHPLCSNHGRCRGPVVVVDGTPCTSP